MEESARLSKAVVLVGGEGTRLRPLTYHVPKAMMPVLNRPFIEHTIGYLKKWGIEDIILATSYLPESIQSYLGDGSRLGVRLSYAVESVPMGTAGAIRNVRQYLNGTFAVLNGDIFTDIDIADMLAFHQQKRSRATIALTWVDNPCAFGIIETGSEGRVRHFIEKPSPDRVTTNWINAGVYILEPEVLEHVPASSHYMFEAGLFPLLIELGEPVFGYSFSGYWLDMGTPEKYLQLNYDILLSKVSSPIIRVLDRDEVRCDKGAFIHPSARMAGPILICNRCKIGPKVNIKGPAVIGPDCTIGEGASIEETVLWGGVNIGTGASLKQCIACSNARVEADEQVFNRVVTRPD